MTVSIGIWNTKENPKNMNTILYLRRERITNSRERERERLQRIHNNVQWIGSFVYTVYFIDKIHSWIEEEGKEVIYTAYTTCIE